MNDIDTLKFYPILRSGTFETSFPLILQSRSGDDLSDDVNYEEKLQVVIDSILNEKPLPDVLKPSYSDKRSFDSPVALVELSQGVLFETYYGKPTGRIEGVAVDIQITNRVKEVRYFNCPIFQSSLPIVGTNDSFQFLDAVVPVSFPAKLEFGQQVSVSYKLVSNNIAMFASLLDKDPHATIKAVVTTTLGERCESAPLEIAEIVENSKYVK